MKGQRFRIYDSDSDQVIQGENSCELHISIETESEQNKDNPHGISSVTTSQTFFM